MAARLDSASVSGLLVRYAAVLPGLFDERTWDAGGYAIPYRDAGLHCPAAWTFMRGAP
jgi:hypothetical protein